MTRPDKLEILYVDDEPANLRSFKSAFRRLYKVHIADHPSKAMDLIKEKDLKIVVSDHRMPDLVGTDLLREVHNYDDKIKRVILSGFVSKEELVEANNAFGLHAYIPKPWDFEDVNATFERLLSEEVSPKMNYE